MSAKMRNTAQVCIAPNRIYVQAGIHDAIANLLKERVEKLRVGSGFTEGVTVGPLISKSAQEKVNRHIDDAIKRGARVLFDGRQRRLDNPEYEKGFFVQPTLVSDTPPDALVNNEETFGPLIALSIFKTEEEAIRLANATDAGLAAYIYTNDLSRTFRVAEALESGMVSVNGASISNAATPFGGVKESGIGREGSKYGLEEYVEKKLIAIGIKTSPEN
jgi:acyl-CoA reductase-like NAD-dependent aldehyde dehydrogenase